MREKESPTRNEGERGFPHKFVMYIRVRQRQRKSEQWERAFINFQNPIHTWGRNS